MNKDIEKKLAQNIEEDVRARLTRKRGPGRVLAAVIDLVITFIIMSFVAVFIAFPVANNLGLRQAAYETTVITTLSGLYELDSDNSYVEIKDEEKFPKALYAFYVDRYDEENQEYVRGYSPLLNESDSKNYNSVDDYYDFILDRGADGSPFDFSVALDEESPWQVAIKPGFEFSAERFYILAFDNALDELYRYPDLVNATYEFIGISLVTLAVSFIVSALPLMLIVPLLNKDGVSLGKLLTNTTMANKYGYNLTKQQAFFRGLTGFLLYYLLFIIPISLVSMLFMFSKKGKSLADIVAFTVVLDKKKSVIYRDASEEKYYNIRRAKNLVKIRHRQESISQELFEEKNLNN